jgi:carboxymethylenebutenolidase
MIAETIAVEGHGGDRIHAYYARPAGPGPFPGMVLFHHRPGWDEFYKETTRRFAHHGYLAICPDLYCRTGHGEPDDVAARVRAEGDVTDDQVVGDGIGSIEFLRAQPTSDGKVGLFGTCSGGRHAYLTACRSDRVAAVVDCWGGRVVMAPDDLNDTYPVAPIDLTADLACPVLGLFGDDDRAPSPEQVDVHEQALKRHGKTYEFHRYPGAGHGFFYYDRPASYRAEQAVDGWAKVWSFLSHHLKEA